MKHLKPDGVQISPADSAVSLCTELPYKTTSTFGKAKRKVENALPKSPRKRVAVIRKIASDVLGLKDHDSHTQTGHQLDENTVLLIKEYYEKESISRMMPGKADVISVKSDDGTRTSHQKRHMIMTIAKTFEAFKSDHPDIKVGKSKFAELRPKYVLLTSKMPQNVCVWVYISFC